MVVYTETCYYIYIFTPVLTFFLFRFLQRKADFPCST